MAKNGDASKMHIRKFPESCLKALRTFGRMRSKKITAPMWSGATWRVKRTLDRNRALLRALRTEPQHAEEEANEWLARRGFDFGYHTHVTTTEEGKLAVMCFDEGYVLEAGGVVPVHRHP
jgi:hypothetical protein